MSSHAAHKLSALFVKKTNKPGKYSDGLGLYLIVEPTGSKRWEQRLTIRGKRCDLGLLGSTKLVTLEEARLTAQSNKKTAKDGGDPRQLRFKVGEPRSAVLCLISLYS